MNPKKLIVEATEGAYKVTKQVLLVGIKVLIILGVFCVSFMMVFKLSVLLMKWTNIPITDDLQLLSIGCGLILSTFAATVAFVKMLDQ